MDLSKERFDIIIQAGQSNSQGCGRGDGHFPFVPNDRIWYLNGDGTYEQAAEQEIAPGDVRGNFSLSFAARYVKRCLEPGRRLLIIRAAVGGTGFLDNRWGMKDDLYQNMILRTQEALRLGSENRLMALLWHQGETDAVLYASKDLHYDNLANLATSVRARFSRKTLPFIAGDFVHHWKGQNEAICQPVIEAIKAVCNDIGGARFVETDGLSSNDQVTHDGDMIHFSRGALDELGGRYFEAYCDIIGV